ncbi:MAG: gamma-mobile-trio protein GmtX [Methylobacter sp.]|uniref:gamma-mobile-trio protein GmtX n=1 Tax=Methylobacter sp. TaxID=2051955 RepID=UPI0025DEA574|nr:gamma-mobile-trio protein GmtX [Methylobacter sp.]MCK9621005.1 gamma-mobile-trio protein GmtX [Methylobacter sp.]
MSPELLLIKLKEKASLKVCETLDSIYQVCIEQQERGIDDYSFATIERLGYKRGVPKAQSIRNKSGEKYRALIKCFSEQNPVKDIAKLSRREEDWIEEISNPKHKLLVKIQASELRAAKKQISEILPPNLRIDVYDHKHALTVTEYKLSDQERRALEYLLSSSFQQKWNLTANEYGELIDSNNSPVFKVATLDAIKKALDFL